MKASVLNPAKCKKGIRIPYSTLKDSGLLELFSEENIEILAYPCESYVIALRQQIFKAFDKGILIDEFTSAASILEDIEKVAEYSKASNSLFKQMIVFGKILNQYIKVIEQLSSLPEVNSLISSLKSEASANLDTIKENLPLVNEYRELISSISEFGVKIDSGYLSVTPQNDVVTVTDDIVNCCRMMGYDISAVNHSPMQINLAFEQLLVQSFKAQFEKIETLYNKLLPAVDLSIVKLKNELKFYLKIYSIVSKLREQNIPYCYAEISDVPVFLAHDLYNPGFCIKELPDIVPNDVELEKSERLYFVMGANGGGKTSYIRTIISSLILFLGGCPVFGNDARIFPFRKLFTHFPADEKINADGRLAEEKRRASEILSEADEDTIVFFNETYTGANEAIGIELSLETMKALNEKNASGYFVTHFHAAGHGGFPVLQTVVDVSEDNRRTYKIQRVKSTSSSYANDILRKYGVDSDSLKAFMNSYGKEGE